MNTFDVKSIIIGALVAVIITIVLNETLKFKETHSESDHTHKEFERVMTRSELEQFIKECNVYVMQFSQNTPSGYIECQYDHKAFRGFVSRWTNREP